MTKNTEADTELEFSVSNQKLNGIHKIIVFSEKIILLLNANLFGERNVRCYDFFGNLIWTIAAPIRIHSETYFVGIGLENELLLVYSQDGVEYQVSIETGSFDRYELVK